MITESFTGLSSIFEFLGLRDVIFDKTASLSTPYTYANASLDNSEYVAFTSETDNRQVLNYFL